MVYKHRDPDVAYNIGILDSVSKAQTRGFQKARLVGSLCVCCSLLPYSRPVMDDENLA